MFTGIIEELGWVKTIKSQKNLVGLRVAVSKILKGTKPGDSIAVNGVCLTVAAMQKPNIFCFDIMKETIRKTTLKDLQIGSAVNLERALKADSRFGGHFVSGHVDGVSVITKTIRRTNYKEFQVSFAPEFRRFIVPKGSITLDGVSLTVGEVGKNIFSVYLIPHTLKVTTLGTKKEHDTLNMEVDLLARYILAQN